MRTCHGTEDNPLIAGQKFAQLTVIKKLNSIPKQCKNRIYYKHMYLCQCSCGKKVIVIKMSLISGDTKSCGCYRIKQCGIAHRTQKYLASLKAIYNTYQHKAKSRKIIFNLSLYDFKNLTSGYCYYCGTKPKQITKSHKSHYWGSYIYNGIDRVDNNKGYFISNCVPCCKQCNYAKHELSLRQFYQLIRKIYEKRIKQ